jgi:hypothetical protein
MGRFVKPETLRLELADGAWVEVKRDLNIWEDKKYRAAGLKRLSGAQDAGTAAIDIDWAEMALARADTYIVDWNFSDDNGKSAAYSAAALRNLSPEAFEELDAAIVKHIEAMSEEKKLKAGAAKSIPA